MNRYVVSVYGGESSMFTPAQRARIERTEIEADSLAEAEMALLVRFGISVEVEHDEPSTRRQEIADYENSRGSR